MKLALTTTLVLGAGICSAQNCPWDLEMIPNPDGSLILYGIDGIAKDNIWATGQRRISQIGDSRILNYLSHWDGSSWSEVVVPQPSELRNSQRLYDVLGIDDDTAIAVGSYRTPTGETTAQSMRWDGSSWDLMQSPEYSGGSGFLGLGKAGDQVWGVGTKDSELSPPASLSFPMAARLHGNGWDVVYVPPLAEIGGRSINALRDIEGNSEDDAWAVGKAEQTGPGGFGPVAMMVRWDGASWSQYDLFPILSSTSFSGLEAIEVISADNAWAAGYDYDLSRQQTIPLIVHWDGSEWSNVAVPTFDHNAELRAITVRAPNDIYAAGTQTDADGYPHALILHYDGSDWSVIPEPELADFGTWFRAMATVDGEVWAAGQSNDLSPGIAQRQVECTACPADLNSDGTLDFFDVSAFLGAYSAQDLDADFDADGVLTFFDISAYLSDFGAGCP